MSHLSSQNTSSQRVRSAFPEGKIVNKLKIEKQFSNYLEEPNGCGKDTLKSQLNNLVLKSKAHCFHIQMHPADHKSSLSCNDGYFQIYLAGVLSVRDSFSSKQKTI